MRETRAEILGEIGHNRWMLGAVLGLAVANFAKQFGSAKRPAVRHIIDTLGRIGKLEVLAHALVLAGWIPPAVPAGRRQNAVHAGMPLNSKDRH